MDGSSFDQRQGVLPQLKDVEYADGTVDAPRVVLIFLLVSHVRRNMELSVSQKRLRSRKAE